MSCVTMTYDTKWSGNIIKTLEINDLSEITCYFANLVFIFADSTTDSDENGRIWNMFLKSTKNSFKIKDGEIRSSSITILCKVGKLMKDPIKKVDLS